MKPSALNWTKITKAQSEIIRGWAWDQVTMTLYVKFYDYRVFTYNLSIDVTGEWAKAISFGRFFHSYIKPFGGKLCITHV